jgi:hypothetical protein
MGDIWTKVCCDAPWEVGYLRYPVYWGNAMRVGFSVKGPGQLLLVVTLMIRNTKGDNVSLYYVEFITQHSKYLQHSKSMSRKHF